MTVKVYIVEDGVEAGGVRVMFASHHGYECVSDIYDADMIVFVGGEDVNPQLYGHAQHPRTFMNPIRDQLEREYFIEALNMGLPMVGICRGGQFLHVMNGGEMYQHVDNHNGVIHDAWAPGNVKAAPYRINSVHHQMMRENTKVPNEVLLVSNASHRREYMSPLLTTSKWTTSEYSANDVPTDIEAIFYPESRCLCFQPHPEYSGVNNHETRELFFDFIDEHILGEMLPIVVLDQATG
jgi:gamma-glutamyl-gamma-aminobutyrate hydrolase PuuD